jgi:hypothetical protein
VTRIRTAALVVCPRLGVVCSELLCVFCVWFGSVGEIQLHLTVRVCS